MAAVKFKEYSLWCIYKYLSWDMLFKKSYYATARDELEKNKDSMNELEGIGKNL